MSKADLSRRELGAPKKIGKQFKDKAGKTHKTSKSSGSKILQKGSQALPQRISNDLATSGETSRSLKLFTPDELHLREVVIQTCQGEEKELGKQNKTHQILTDFHFISMSLNYSRKENESRVNIIILYYYNKFYVLISLKSQKKPSLGLRNDG